jgi:hypothetical protein
MIFKKERKRNFSTSEMKKIFMEKLQNATKSEGEKRETTDEKSV